MLACSGLRTRRYGLCIIAAGNAYKAHLFLARNQTALAALTNPF